MESIPNAMSKETDWLLPQPTQGTAIASLPNDMLKEIFSHLRAIDLVAVSGVNKKWHLLTRSDAETVVKKLKEIKENFKEQATLFEEKTYITPDNVKDLIKLVEESDCILFLNKKYDEYFYNSLASFAEKMHSEYSDELLGFFNSAICKIKNHKALLYFINRVGNNRRFLNKETVRLAFENCSKNLLSMEEIIDFLNIPQSFDYPFGEDFLSEIKIKLAKNAISSLLANKKENVESIKEIMKIISDSTSYSYTYFFDIIFNVCDSDDPDLFFEALKILTKKIDLFQKKLLFKKLFGSCKSLTDLNKLIESTKKQELYLDKKEQEKIEESTTPTIKKIKMNFLWSMLYSDSEMNEEILSEIITEFPESIRKEDDPYSLLKKIKNYELFLSCLAEVDECKIDSTPLKELIQTFLDNQSGTEEKIRFTKTQTVFGKHYLENDVFLIALKFSEKIIKEILLKKEEEEKKEVIKTILCNLSEWNPSLLPSEEILLTDLIKHISSFPSHTLFTEPLEALKRNILRCSPMSLMEK